MASPELPFQVERPSLERDLSDQINSNKGLPKVPVDSCQPSYSDSTSATLNETIDGDFSWRSGQLEKIRLLLASLLPLGAGIALLTFTIEDRRWTGGPLEFVLSNRASAQIISAIISAALAALNIYTATSIVNFAIRIRLVRKTVDMTTLKLIGAIVNRQVVWSLPVALYITTVAMVLICAAPNFLWVGALTPVVVNSTFSESTILKVPRYSDNSSDLWAVGGHLRGECTSVSNSLGTWSNCAAEVAQSVLLRRASLASLDATGGPHPKFDNSQYSYIGRSYGVGTPAGIVDSNDAQKESGSNPRVLQYNYREPGYLAQVDCIRNDTSDWHLELVKPRKAKNGIPAIYYAAGRFPNAPPDSVDFFSVVTLDKDDRSLAVIAAKPHAGVHVVLIAAGSKYSVLNGTQCEIQFQRTEFEVNVDVTQKEISVFPIPESEPEFDPSGELAETVTKQINSLGMLTTTLYTSIVGDSLVANVASAAGESDASELDVSDKSLDAIAGSISAMADTILAYIGSSQYFVPNSGDGEFSLVDAELTVQSIRLGDPVFAYITFILSVVLFGTACLEGLRTCGWRSLPLWNFTDMTCLVISSAAAGDDLLARFGLAGGCKEARWVGDGNALSKAPTGSTTSPTNHETCRQSRFQLRKKVLRLQTADQLGDVLSYREFTAIALETHGSANSRTLAGEEST